jgi:hypothetical protein
MAVPPSRRPSFDEESALLPDGHSPERENASRLVNFAILVNFVANVLLLVAKVIVTLTSSSLSMLASLVDSALDFMSTVIIYGVSRIIQSKDWRSHYQFPVGKARLEPIGVLVFSVLMIVSFIQVGVEAVQRILKGGGAHEVVVLSNQSLIIMASTGMNSPALAHDSYCEDGMLAVVPIDQKLRYSGVITGCHERCCFQVSRRTLNLLTSSTFSIIFPLAGYSGTLRF